MSLKKKTFYQKNKNGGMHHICVDVDDLSKTLKEIADKGIVPLSPPKIGSHGKNVVFLHPKYCGGVLVELQDMKE